VVHRGLIERSEPVELFPKGPITEATAPVHLQRAWYAAIGSAGVIALGGLLSASLSRLVGGLIVIGLGHGMMQRSWVAAAALLVYLVSLLAQAAWIQKQPFLLLLAAVLAYFLGQGFRATWWWRERAASSAAPIAGEKEDTPQPQ
jgi:hypothetical protein